MLYLAVFHMQISPVEKEGREMMEWLYASVGRWFLVTRSGKPNLSSFAWKYAEWRALIIRVREEEWIDVNRRSFCKIKVFDGLSRRRADLVRCRDAIHMSWFGRALPVGSHDRSNTSLRGDDGDNQVNSGVNQRTTPKPRLRTVLRRLTSLSSRTF